ncbi:MAG: dihydropteroate synthase [Actinomycetota bacterium]
MNRSARPKIMAIINATPDSFSDGGRFLDPSVAIEHGLRCLEQGADILDIGGESTRPQAEPVSAEEEIRRVIPIIEGLASRNTLISIDTTKPRVAEAALRAGAGFINDVSGGRDPDMLALAAKHEVPICLMHMRGTPETMQQSPRYTDVVKEVYEYLATRAEAALDAGIARDSIVVDPGIGFGKTADHNLRLLAELETFTRLGYQVLVGTSRKSFIGKTLGDLPVDDRLEGSLATVALAIWAGVSIVRVHDVRETRRVVDIVHAVREAGR